MIKTLTISFLIIFKSFGFAQDFEMMQSGIANIAESENFESIAALQQIKMRRAILLDSLSALDLPDELAAMVDSLRAGLGLGVIDITPRHFEAPPQRDRGNLEPNEALRLSRHLPAVRNDDGDENLPMLLPAAPSSITRSTSPKDTAASSASTA